MAEHAGKPKVRFAGFTETWEQRKLGEIVKIRRGLTYKPSDICENGIRVLRSSNIDGDSFVLNCDDVFVREQAVNIDYARENDILITAANGSSRLVGKHAILSQIPDKSTVHGGFMLLGSTEEPYFINASMGSSWYRRFVELFVAGGNGAIGNLNKNDLDNQDIFVPSKKEQARIGAFFRHLDRLVALHQRKRGRLENIKKAMLEKMFPKNGADVPEVRFVGFTEAWEQRNTSYLGNFFKGQGYSKADLLPDGTPIILYGQLYTNYQFTITEVNTYAQKKKNTILSKGNEVIVPASGETAEDIARASAVRKKGVILGGDLNIIVPIPSMNAEFFALSLSNGFPQKKLAQKAQGKSVVHIHNSDIQEISITYPSLEEQNRIASFFRHLDRLITLHQRKVALLQNIKKACLEKMFV